MTARTSSAPTPEYGAPYLPITTTRKATMEAKLEDVDPAELSDEQRRWLPDPIPAGARVTRCTGCGDIRADVLPGKTEVTWEDHTKGCPGPVLNEAIAAALLASEHFVAAEADLDTDVITGQTTSGLRFTLTLGVASPPFADDPQEAATTVAPLEIPEFDRTWHPNEITGWLADVELEGKASEADLARARQAVSRALGVDD